MALADGPPRIGEVADVQTGFLSPSKWWLWNAFEPLSDSRVFDARCNAWRRTTVAQGARLPRQLDRRYGVLFGDNELAVYAPEWRESPSGAFLSGAIAVFVLDGEQLQWTSVAPAEPPIGHDAQVLHGDGLILSWSKSTGLGALFSLATRRWERLTERLPLLGRGYDCSWIQGGAWLIANPQGVFRLDLASKTWSTVLEPEAPMSTQELGGCLLSSSASGLSVAMMRSLYAPRRALFAIEGAGAAAWELPWPEGSEDPSVVSAGGTVWSRDGTGAGRLLRYDRGARRWVPVAIPKGLDARRAFVSEVQGRAMLVEPPPASAPRPGAVPPGGSAPRAKSAPKPGPTRVSLWSGKSFGRPLTLGSGGALQGEVPTALGGLTAIDEAAIRSLDVTGKERLRLPTPPKWLAYRGFSPEALITWGVMETRLGNDCDNPFQDTRRAPDMPICDPSHEVAYTRIHPGGFVLLRVSGEEAGQR
jgi:hypothetical protein